MAFSTWAALKTAVLDDLAAGTLFTKSYTTAGNRSHTFRDMADVVEFLRYCDEMITAENNPTRTGPSLRGATPV